MLEVLWYTFPSRWRDPDVVHGAAGRGGHLDANRQSAQLIPT